MSRGAVAAGSRHTVEAGLRALRLGGNAVDAAIAASLMAGVAEPLLTGLGGAGLAMVRVAGQVRALDLFTAMPGLGREGAPPPLDEIDVDFGVTVQRFHTGPGAIAVPGLPRGLATLHAAHGTLPLDELGAPAAAAAAKGVEVSEVFGRVAGLLWPILRRDEAVRAVFARPGEPDQPLRAGDTFAWPALGASIAAYCESGGDWLERGQGSERLFSALGPRTRLTALDMSSYRATWGAPLRCRYRDATLWVPGPPSVAGLLVLEALRALEDGGAMPPLGSADAVRRLTAAQELAEGQREGLNQRLFDEDFLSGALRRLRADRRGSAGFTTHISAVDGEGNAVAITHSLGETCGEEIPGTGVLLNNFLGESDVNPADAPRAPGERLYTMCCPCLLERGDQVVALGTGGSNRIRSAILHGVVNLVDYGLAPDAAVAAPRSHVEQGVLHIEAAARSQDVLAALQAERPDLVIFEDRHLFFGGLHIAGAGAGGFVGAGDLRRSGTWGRA